MGVVHTQGLTRKDIDASEQTVKDLNTKITENNKLFDDKSTKETDLRDRVWKSVVSLLDTEYSNYKKSTADRNALKASLEKSIVDNKTLVTNLAKELQDVNDGSVPTEDTVS